MYEVQASLGYGHTKCEKEVEKEEFVPWVTVNFYPMSLQTQSCYYPQVRNLRELHTKISTTDEHQQVQ